MNWNQKIGFQRINRIQSAYLQQLSKKIKTAKKPHNFTLIVFKEVFII